MLAMETMAKIRSIATELGILEEHGPQDRSRRRDGASAFRPRAATASEARGYVREPGFSRAERGASATREVDVAEDPGAAIRPGLRGRLRRRSPAPVPAMGGKAGRRGVRDLRPPEVRPRRGQPFGLEPRACPALGEAGPDQGRAVRVVPRQHAVRALLSERHVGDSVRRP